MKIKDLLLAESSSYINKLKTYAKGHYPDTKDENEALLNFLARSVLHAKEDDFEQNIKIRELTSRLSSIEEIIKKLT